MTNFEKLQTNYVAIKDLEAKRADLDKEIEGYLKELGLLEETFHKLWQSSQIWKGFHTETWSISDNGISFIMSNLQFDNKLLPN